MCCLWEGEWHLRYYNSLYYRQNIPNGWWHYHAWTNTHKCHPMQWCNVIHTPIIATKCGLLVVSNITFYRSLSQDAAVGYFYLSRPFDRSASFTAHASGCNVQYLATGSRQNNTPDSKAHGANMGPIWGRQDPGGPHVGPMKFAIWDETLNVILNKMSPYK